MVIRRHLSVEIPGLAYVTTTVTDWIPIFAHDQAALIAVKQLEETCCSFKASIVGYVLMPSHLHAIINLGSILDLTTVVQTFKSLTSRKIKQLTFSEKNPKFYHKGRFRFWKPRFDDFIIRNEELFWIKLNYIHENPVRAGLVPAATDYHYSSAKDWILGEEGLTKIDRTIVGVRLSGN